ncbi:hypothetical protein PI125_g19506 [Phytophthora idaei]|nr:hypothetical protein PI125_g19506 [Phytophthora idaei]KAG3149542.1 hypothetical protein PI126_g11953 [Phytophthora idaei]
MVLKKFYKDQSGVNRDTTLPPVRLKDGSEGHLIESIIDHRVTKKGIEECKCKWVGRNDDIWEPTANLLSVPGLIKEFHRQPNKLPTRVSTRLRNKKSNRQINFEHVMQQYYLHREEVLFCRRSCYESIRFLTTTN